MSIFKASPSKNTLTLIYNVLSPLLSCISAPQILSPISLQRHFKCQNTDAIYKQGRNKPSLTHGGHAATWRHSGQ